MLLNTNFNRTYNPSGKQNALSDVKRLLTSRDTTAQSKACGYLLDVLTRSEERSRTIEYLLDNDITVFLCEATSNLDFTLFRSIVSCIRQVWTSRQFFSQEHAAHALAAGLRALAHYAASGHFVAVDACLHFLCDLLNGITHHKTTPALSHQSAYSAVQLLACLSSLASQIHTHQNTILSSALVLDALISNQPENLAIKGVVASGLVEVVDKWFELVMGALNHSMLVGDAGNSGMLYVVGCELGISALGLTKLLYHGDRKADFVQSILTDEQEINILKQSAVDMAKSIQRLISDLVVFTKEHQNEIATEEYGVFLKFLLNFFQDSRSEELPDFCDTLFHKGYLTMLPQVQIVRNEVSVRNTSTLVLGELLKVLAEKYLKVDDKSIQDTCAKDIHRGLVELQYGIEKLQTIGSQLQNGQPYSLLIYIYFYCQSSENPQEATATLLPYLVEHILRLPKSFTPPPYIIKALWLVFAMSTISNGSLSSLESRVYLEKATARLIEMLYPEPAVFYTHNPAVLLWAFTSQRISNQVRYCVVSQWLKFEDTLPTELTTVPAVWKLLLDILVQHSDSTVVENCMEALQTCLEDVDEEISQQFSNMVWSALPDVLSKALVDCDSQVDTNICYLLDLATTLLPLTLDQTMYLETAVLITAIFTNIDAGGKDTRNHFEYVCLKLGLYLLGLACNQGDNRVLLTYTNRPGFLAAVLAATDSGDDRVACVSLQLLSCVVHYYTKNKYQPEAVLEIQTHVIIKSLRCDGRSERGASLLQLVYMVLHSGVHCPLALAYDAVPVTSQCNAIRALMFRIQLMLCCKEFKDQSTASWKTLSSVFKYAIVSKKDTKLAATLTSQPWTHTLIHFQFTQNITQEFLTFIHDWLTLLRITIKKSQEQKRSSMNRKSMVVKTMALLKKNIKETDVKVEFKDTAKKIDVIVGDILKGLGIKL